MLTVKCKNEPLNKNMKYLIYIPSLRNVRRKVEMQIVECLQLALHQEFVGDT